MEFKPYPKAKDTKRKSRKSERGKIFLDNKKLSETKRKERKKQKED